MKFRSVLITTICAFLLIATCVKSADTLPREIPADAFWRLINNLSEEGGFFRFQFMSNEREFTSVVQELKKTVKPGGVYLGVGPEQNFTYIAATQPKIAFIFDIRRENMIEHLIYKALFEMSQNRAEFVSRLFSRKPSGPLSEKSTVKALFQAFTTSRSDTQLFNQNLRAIKETLTTMPAAQPNNRTKSPRFQLSARDLTDIDNIYETIFTSGPGSEYDGPFGGFRGGSNYAGLMTATDNEGHAWSYLATEENYQFVRAMEQKNLIVPLVGDFAGPKTIRTVGTYLKEHGSTVSTFYTSNVEQYLFQQDDDWRRFYASAATLPLDATSIFIRSAHYAFGPSTTTRQSPRTSYFMLRSSIADLTKAFNAGRIRSYDDVIRMSY